MSNLPELRLLDDELTQFPTPPKSSVLATDPQIKIEVQPPKNCKLVKPKMGGGGKPQSMEEYERLISIGKENIDPPSKSKKIEKAKIASSANTKKSSNGLV